MCVCKNIFEHEEILNLYNLVLYYDLDRMILKIKKMKIIYFNTCVYIYIYIKKSYLSGSSSVVAHMMVTEDLYGC